MQPYAHTHPDHPDDLSHWEPLFTPGCATTGGQNTCPECASLSPDHGHLNKVAHLAARFAAEMFPPGSGRHAARHWGHLAGLWHDLGKFAPEWQTYLTSKAAPHTADTSGKLDHTTAGAQHSHQNLPHFGTLIAGHHAGIAPPESSLEKHVKKNKKDAPTFAPHTPPEIPTFAHTFPPHHKSISSSKPQSLAKPLFSPEINFV